MYQKISKTKLNKKVFIAVVHHKEQEKVSNIKIEPPSRKEGE